MMGLHAWMRVAGVCCTIALSGCAAQMLHRTGMEMIAEGRYDTGLDALAKAAQAAPDDVVLRKDYLVARGRVANALLASSRQKQSRGDAAGAEADLRRLLALDPGNAAATQGLRDLRRAAGSGEILAAARRALDKGDREQAAALLRSILADDPRHRGALELQRELEQPAFRAHFAEADLKSAYPKPINLEFRDASVRQVLEALARTNDINFIFDKDVPADLRTTVVLRNANIDEVLDLILRNCQLRRKVLNRTTVQIYPDTPEKRKEYQELVVRAFYLQDASATQIQTVLKSLLKLKDIVVDERLNLVTVRDTPEAIALAERLVALHDLAEPEVMLELEVLEVQRDDLLKLGMQWPNQLTVVMPTGSRGGTLSLDDVKHLDSKNVGLAFDNPSVSLRQDASRSNLLANPSIRVHNREKANILIGDKVPVITTTSNATGFVAENVQYLDVGLKLNAEPLIHPSSEVSIRLNLEVSSIANQVSTPNGTVAYQVGTRNASTFLRLHDGETQVLAGLISDQERHSASGVPGLSRIPLLGRLFSAPSDNNSKTEIVLSITPHVVRPPLRPAAQPVEFWSGTENGLDTRPLRLSDNRGETAAAPDAAAAPGATPAFAPAAPLPPQFVWSGPNQVKAGETFALSLRVIAAAGATGGEFALATDKSVLEILDVTGPPDAGANGVAFDRAAQAVRLNLGGPMDGQLLTMTVRAKVPVEATSVQIGAAQAGAPAAAAPYPIKVTP